MFFSLLKFICIESASCNGKERANFLKYLFSHRKNIRCIDNRCRDELSTDCKFLLSHMYRIYTNFVGKCLAAPKNTINETHKKIKNRVNVCGSLGADFLFVSSNLYCVRACELNFCVRNTRGKATKNM